jgi:hypothetical protein
MGRAFSMREGKDECIQVIGWESQKERDFQNELDIGGHVILRWAFERFDGVVWTVFVCFRIGTNGGFCESDNELLGSIECREGLK